jgi:hypothetical protein
MNSFLNAVAPRDADDAHLRNTRPSPRRGQSVDETARARFVIEAWLALDPHSHDGSLAQLIAASIHGGSGTALERFASTGILEGEAALAELNDVEVPIEREPWLDALGRYIIAAGKRS